MFVGQGKIAERVRKARLSLKSIEQHKFNKVSVEASTQLSAANFSHLHSSFRFMKFSSKNHWFIEKVFPSLFSHRLSKRSVSLLEIISFVHSEAFRHSSQEMSIENSGINGKNFAIKDSFKMEKVSCSPQRKSGKDIPSYSFNFLCLMV